MMILVSSYTRQIHPLRTIQIALDFQKEKNSIIRRFTDVKRFKMAIATL